MSTIFIWGVLFLVLLLYTLLSVTLSLAGFYNDKGVGVFPV